MKDLYQKLLEREWKGKPLWQHIKEKRLTSVPCMAGNKREAKIMIVGRAVNGWKVDFDNCGDIHNTVNSVLTQRNRLDDFAGGPTEYYEAEEKKKYYYTTAFWRLVKKLVIRIDRTDEEWQQKIIWTNLYKVSPKKRGNPAWSMIKNDLDVYIEILKKEIEDNAPKLVVFVTDWNYIKPYRDRPSFDELLDCDEKKYDDNYIVKTGKIKNTDIPFVVCKRPERRNTDKLADAIVKAHKKLIE